ncbi:hypothetical protein I3760_06G126900 [Carya illinoinensis]|nr:hypothetical protein I3760_06G126900 [Carya illinoinensis]
MAATVSPWAKPGAWALDSEEQDAELQQQQQNHDQPISGIPTEPLPDFPSLSAAAATKPKKKKGQTLSHADFISMPTRTSHPLQQPQGLTPEEFLALPSGPRQRSAEELEQDRHRLGGGFRSYGSNNNGRYSSGDDSNSRWGSSRVSDEPRRNGSFNRDRDRDSDRDSAPSRADEIDNWAAAKKPTVGNNGFDRREKGGGSVLFNSQSRADDSDNWGSNKAFVPSMEGRRSSGERRVGFASNGAADSDNWARSKKELSTGAGGVTERPRLNLQPRTLPVSNGEKQEGAGMVSKPSRASNPFGEARPREDVLAEKGKNWKTIDEQLETTKNEVVEKAERPSSFGKRGFGLGNGRLAVEEDNRTWRKPESVESSHPQSDETIEDGSGEEKLGEVTINVGRQFW